MTFISLFFLKRSESVIVRNDQPGWLARLRDSYMAYHYHLPSQAQPGPQAAEDNIPTSSTSKLEDEVKRKSRRGRPRKHAPKIPLPPLYVFIRYPKPRNPGY